MDKKGLSIDIPMDIRHPLLRQLYAEIALRMIFTPEELNEMDDREFDLIAEIILTFRPIQKLMSPL